MYYAKLLLVLCLLSLNSCDTFGTDLPPMPTAEIITKLDECTEAGYHGQVVRRNKIAIWVNCYEVSAMENKD